MVCCCCCSWPQVVQHCVCVTYVHSCVWLECGSQRGSWRLNRLNPPCYLSLSVLIPPSSSFPRRTSAAHTDHKHGRGRHLLALTCYWLSVKGSGPVLLHMCGGSLPYSCVIVSILNIFLSFVLFPLKCWEHPEHPASSSALGRWMVPLVPVVNKLICFCRAT